MSGGGSDFPPPELPNGGEFLLSLLQGSHQRPPQNSSRPPPPQALTLDPAVATVGPTLQFPLHHVPNGLDPSPSRPQNLSPPFPHAFPHNYVGFADDFRRLGVGHPGSGSRGMTQQRDNNVRFGSFSLEIEPFERLPDGNTVESSSLDNFRDVGSASRTHDRLERNRQFNGRGDSSSSSNTSGPGYLHSRDQEKGGGGWAKHNQGANVPRSAPPGFAARPRDGGNVGFREIRRGFEHNAGERSGNFHDLSHRNSSSVDESLRTRGLGFNDHRVHSRVPGETALAGQLDRPGPPQGSDLHSILGSQIEESLANLHFGNVEEENREEIGGQHRIKRYGGGVDATEFDDLHEQIVDALLEDESEEKRKKLQPASREKEYRSDSRGQRILSQSKRISKRLMHCRSDIHRLNAPFLRIYESLIPPEEEKAKQRQLLSLLEKLVNKEWPDARLYLYGSCANSFDVCKSDIDVCLALQDAELDKSEVLLKLADILQSDNLQNVQALTRARVPIVKLMDPVTGISCDICMNNVLAVVNTKLLRDYAQIDERLRQLAYIVKHWAKSRGVNETYQGTLSSYAYVLMCIHFLQQRRPAILPCLQEMEATYSVTVDDKYCAFFDQVEKLRDFGSRNKETIAQLVWAFFNYWAYRHDYTNDVISVRTGCLLSKQEKDWTRRVGNDRHLICIEDPFDISHDLGRVVDKFSIRVLREEFERAAEVMQYDPNPWAKLFEPYISS